MMKDAAVFSVLSKCFAPMDDAEWKRMTERSAWAAFLDGARRMLQDEGAFGANGVPQSRRHHASCPLQDFLTEGEVRALYCPPTAEEKRAFAARHFTGGLPESALPIESLYRSEGASQGVDLLGAAKKGRYFGQSARYMEALAASLGFEVPQEFSACPDHLALELDVVAVLLRSNLVAEAATFMLERFDWLTEYRLRLLGLPGEARFYIGLIDVILGIRAQLGSGTVGA